MKRIGSISVFLRMNMSRLFYVHILFRWQSQRRLPFPEKQSKLKSVTKTERPWVSEAHLGNGLGLTRIFLNKKGALPKWEEPLNFLGNNPGILSGFIVGR